MNNPFRVAQEPTTTDRQPKIDESPRLLAALIDGRSIFQSITSIVTPREAMEVLREHCLREILAGREVTYCHDGLPINAMPYPYKDEGMWRLHSNHREWYEPVQNVIAQVREATMFALNLEPALGEVP